MTHTESQFFESRPAARPATPNELSYLDQQNETHRVQSRIFGGFLFLFSMVLLLSGIWGAIADIWMSLILLPFGALLGWLSLGLIGLGSKPEKNTHATVYQIRGVYQIKTVGQGRSAHRQAYIGDYAVEFPKDWRDALGEGRPVTAEAVFDDEHLFGTGTLVSLKDTHRIDDEVRYGRLDLKVNHPLILAVIFIIVFLPLKAFFSWPVSLSQLPDAFVAQYVEHYSLADTLALEQTLPNLKTGDWVTIKKAYRLWTGNHKRTILINPNKREETLLAGFFKTDKSGEIAKQYGRLGQFAKIDSQEFVENPSLFEQFSEYNDNPQYQKLKKASLMDSAEQDTDDSFKLVRQTFLIRDLKKAFVQSEKSNIAERNQQAKHAMSTEMFGKYVIKHFKIPSRIEATMTWEEGERLKNRVESPLFQDAPYYLWTDISGRLEIIDSGDDPHISIDRRFCHVKEYELWSALIQLILGLATLFLLIKGIARLNQNSRIKEKMYEALAKHQS